MTNADKIVWGPASINELKRALGLIEETDDSPEYDEFLGLQPPWPIIVSSQSSIIGSDGSAEITAVLTFDEVDGATGYQVRISPAEDFDVVDMPENYTALSVDGASWSDGGSNFFEHTATTTLTVEAGDVGLIVGPAHTTGYTGAFSTWTEIYGGGEVSDLVGSLGIWMGTGVGTGSAVVCTPGPGTLTDQSHFIFIHLKAVTSLTQTGFGSSYFSNIDESTVTTLASPTISGPNGKLVLTAVRSDGGLSNRVAANGYWLDSGFYGKYARKVENGSSNAFYNNGVACSIGIALGESVSTTFGVWVDGTSADGETATFVFTMGS